MQPGHQRATPWLERACLERASPGAGLRVKASLAAGRLELASLDAGRLEPASAAPGRLEPASSGAGRLELALPGPGRPEPGGPEEPRLGPQTATGLLCPAGQSLRSSRSVLCPLRWFLAQSRLASAPAARRRLILPRGPPARPRTQQPTARLRRARHRGPRPRPTRVRDSAARAARRFPTAPSPGQRQPPRLSRPATRVVPVLASRAGCGLRELTGARSAHLRSPAALRGGPRRSRTANCPGLRLPRHGPTRVCRRGSRPVRKCQRGKRSRKKRGPAARAARSCIPRLLPQRTLPRDLPAAWAARLVRSRVRRTRRLTIGSRRTSPFTRGVRMPRRSLPAPPHPSPGPASCVAPDPRTSHSRAAPSPAPAPRDRTLARLVPHRQVVGPPKPHPRAPGPPALRLPASGRLVPRRLALGRPAVGRTALGRPALGRPALGRPALGRQALGRQALGRQALGRPALGRPVPSRRPIS